MGTSKISLLHTRRNNAENFLLLMWNLNLQIVGCEVNSGGLLCNYRESLLPPDDFSYSPQKHRTRLGLFINPAASAYSTSSQYN
jgi:hypothetical protein